MSKNLYYKSILGEFIIDEKFTITKKPNKHTREPNDKDMRQILHLFNDPKYFVDYRNKNLAITKEKIMKSVSDDLYIIQAINAYNEVSRSINTLTKRLRELVAYPMPDLSEHINNNEAFIEHVININKINKEDDMSFLPPKENLLIMKNFAKLITTMIKEKEEILIYIEKAMEKLCPNLSAVAGASLGAKLLSIQGSLEGLAKAPASRIQLLGAEEALFRHLKTGAKPPKHGVIHEHMFVQKSREKGKAARRLADKISMAVKIDFFKGKFIGDKLRGELK